MLWERHVGGLAVDQYLAVGKVRREAVGDAVVARYELHGKAAAKRHAAAVCRERDG